MPDPWPDGRTGGDGAGPQVDPGDVGALQFLASCLAAAQHSVSTLLGGQQPIGWLDWAYSRRAALGELVAAACDGGFGGAVFPGSRHPHPVGAPAHLLLDHTKTSFLTFDIACGALILAQPAAAHDGNDVPASPRGPVLLVGLAAHRIAFSLSIGAALGTNLTALAHPSMALAALAAQRDAAA